MEVKFSSNFVCQQCGYVSPSFMGKCPECGTWNSLVETVESPSNGKSKSKKGNTNAKPIKLAEVASNLTTRLSTGISELDTVLGGGIVPGMAVLLSGEPGIGKSTLLLQLVEQLGSSQFTVHSNKDNGSKTNRNLGIILYIAGEESASQIKIRASRLGVKAENLLVLEDTDVDDVVNLISKEAKTLSLLIVDSIQTLTTQDLTGTAGSVGQVRECAARLISATKGSGLPLFLVGHVTKDGTIAGPKVLEHIVDTVLNFEGDKYSNLRLLRTSKNRFGPTDEVGLFEMSDTGLKEIVNYQGFTIDAAKSSPGSCLTVTMEGTRPMLAEIQALVTETPIPNPRRVARGVDHNRLLTIVAILQKRLNIPLYKEDVYVNVSGGLNISEPAGDLAMALAILSSYRDRALPAGTVALGELDLLGNVRKINSLERRVKEAKKLGFKNILAADNLTSLTSFKL